MGSGFPPLDGALGLVPGELSPRLAEGAVRLGTQLPFARAAGLLGFFWGVAVSADTVRRCAEAAGAALVALEQQAVARLEREFPAPPPGPDVAQWSMDGAFVPLVHGEWAEVKTAAFGVVQAAPGPAGEPVVQTIDLSYFSRLGEVGPFSRELRAELHRRGIQAAQTVVAVNDGAEWIQGVVDAYRPDAVRILDFPHAASYLAQAAQATFGADSLAAARWLAQQTRLLKDEPPERALAALRALPAEQAVAAPAAVDARQAALGYLEPRCAQLRYAAFRAKGYPIGSGAMESACKLVVEARLKGSGMHWARPNVSPMVALRAVLCAGRWDAVWPTIQQRRRQEAWEDRLRCAHQRHPPAPLPAPAPAAAKPRVHLSRAHERLHAAAPPKIVNGRPTADHPFRRSFKQAG